MALARALDAPLALPPGAGATVADRLPDAVRSQYGQGGVSLFGNLLGAVVLAATFAPVAPAAIVVAWCALFSLLWLKDHCPSPKCLHPDTKQRQIDTFAIPENLSARAVALEENGSVLRVEWNDDEHVSRCRRAHGAGCSRAASRCGRRADR